MSNTFTEDDLHDYANDDEYDEEEITEEDDAKLAQLVPEVKKNLTGYIGYTFDDIYYELWENYMDVNETVKSLKSKPFFYFFEFKYIIVV